MQKVSLYIPCYNAQSYIDKCLSGVMKQTYPPDEILVIDDGSADKTVEIASRYPVKIISHAGNEGLASARNTAFRNARNEYVASLDADCVPEPGWLQRLMQDFTGDNVAGAGGKLLESNLSGVVNKWRSVYMRQHWGNERIINPRFLFGSNNVFRKNALIKAGMYDPALRTNYEDCDMSLRLRGLGYTLIYDPEAVAYHLRTDNLKSLINTFARWTLTGTGGRRRPDNFYNLCCKVYDNLIYSGKMVIKDVMAGRIGFLPIDILVFFNNVRFDIRYYLSKSLFK
ncbi:MAG: glycosyltransferase [Candidatus Omnitrophica bacterium]|nr:glycosyltransferase [Candidatus Omnitrophota bacterium]